MRSSIALGALSALALVAAQNFTIDPNSVSVSTRNSWCQAQINNCMILCGGSFAVTPTDTCDYSTLSYSCLCSNGTAPGLQYYTGTMPYFICTEAWEQCNAANENNAQGQTKCTKTIKDHCGTLTPVSPTDSSGSSSPSGTSGSGSTGTSNSSASGSSSGPSSAKTTTPSHAAAVGTYALTLANGAAVVAVMGLAALL